MNKEFLEKRIAELKREILEAKSRIPDLKGQERLDAKEYVTLMQSSLLTNEHMLQIANKD